jgi:hypothetical protein
MHDVLRCSCRRTRTIPAEVKELKAQLPKPDAEGNRPSSPLDAQISELESVGARDGTLHV